MPDARWHQPTQDTTSTTGSRRSGVPAFRRDLSTFPGKFYAHAFTPKGTVASDRGAGTHARSCSSGRNFAGNASNAGNAGNSGKFESAVFHFFKEPKAHTAGHSLDVEELRCSRQSQLTEWKINFLAKMAAGIASKSEHSRVTPDFSDLRCTETLDDTVEDIPVEKPVTPLDPTNLPPVKALPDPTLLQDDRVLQNLLRLEDKFLPAAPDYFRFVQTEIVPSMRKIVADWMLQVCQELQCQPEVFCLAMNYLDRFLARCRVTKGKLQLIGSVCLLLSSKFKETCPISGEKLIFYSDFSITSDEIKVKKDDDDNAFLINVRSWFSRSFSFRSTRFCEQITFSCQSNDPRSKDPTRHSNT